MKLGLLFIVVLLLLVRLVELFYSSGSMLARVVSILLDVVCVETELGLLFFFVGNVGSVLVQLLGSARVLVRLYSVARLGLVLRQALKRCCHVVCVARFWLII